MSTNIFSYVSGECEAGEGFTLKNFFHPEKEFSP
jgi:hypothetical protein